jgi:uncharacterized metal-binding protein YceD (DUF177 family)
VPMGAGEADAGVAPEKPNPFAVLAQLKNPTKATKK